MPARWSPSTPTGHVPSTSPRGPLGLPRAAWWAVFAVLAIVVTVVSLLPPRGTPVAEIADLGEVRALVGHACGYLLLAGSAMLAQRMPRPWLTVILASAYGVLLELVQGVIGQRSAQLSDAIANLIGALLGVGIAMVIRTRS